MQPPSEHGVDSCNDRENYCNPDFGSGNGPVRSLVTVSPTAQRKLFSTPLRPEKARPIGAQQPAANTESEGESDLNEFQRVMRREHRQALASVNKACVVMERNRRKRITVSCSRLRQLLPPVLGARSDMVTVLEMAVVFLQCIHECALRQQCRELLFPPGDLCRRWLSRIRQRRLLGRRLGWAEESGTVRGREHAEESGSSPEGARGMQQQADTLLEPQNMASPRPAPLREQTPLRVSAPSFWCSPALMLAMTPAYQTPQATSWSYCDTPHFSEDTPCPSAQWPHVSENQNNL